MRRVEPKRPRFTKPGPTWHRELPGRVRRYFDERRLVKYVLATALSCFVVGYLLVTFLFFPGFGRSPIVTVPDLGGRTLAQATRAADRSGLELEKGGELPNGRVGRGRVLMQTPHPGEEVTRGTEVRVVLSAGPEMRPVPGVTGLPRAEVIALLRRYGFRPMIRRVLDRSEEGTIIGLQPAAGRQVPAGSAVAIVISAGPPKVLVPGVVGLTVGDAADRLRAGSLELGSVRWDSAGAAEQGTVLAQTPAAGDSLRMGGRVRLVVAGYDPNPPPPPADTAVVDTFATVSDDEEEGEEPEPEPEEEPEEGEEPRDRSRRRT